MLIDKLNKGMKAEYDPFLCSCHELKADGYSAEYKCAYCILKSTLSKEIKKLTDSHKEEKQAIEYKMSKQELQFKYMGRDHTKLKQDFDEQKLLNDQLTIKIEELKEGKNELLNDNIQLKHRVQEFEEKIKNMTASFADKEMKIMLTNSNKVQELENKIDKDNKETHDLKHKISELEITINNLKQEKLIQSNKIEDLKYSEIELQEKLKNLQDTYQDKVTHLSSSQKESENKWKDSCNNLSRELDKSKERTRVLELQLVELQGVQKENEAIKSKIVDLESSICEYSKQVQHQKSLIFKQAGEKEDLNLELEKQAKLFEVEINERDNKIKHLQTMIEKYKKIDASFKQLQQEFAMKLMALEKKNKRERESKLKVQEELKLIKRELLEKESQWKRQVSAIKNQELKGFTEWDLNKITQKLE